MEETPDEGNWNGWDPVKRTFDMDDEWWKKARAVSVFCFQFSYYFATVFT